MAWSATWLTYSAIQVGAVDADGKPSPAVTLTTTSGLSGRPRVVAMNDDYAVLWRDERTIRMAVADASGHLVRLTSVIGDSDPFTDPMVAADHGRIALVFQPNGVSKVRAVIVDSLGRIIADRSTLLPAGRVGAIAFEGDNLVIAVSAILSSLVRIPVSGGAITTAPLKFTISVHAIATVSDGFLTVWTTNRGEGLTSATAGHDGNLITLTALARELYEVNWPSVARTAGRYVLTFAATPDPKLPYPTGIYSLLLDESGRALGSPVKILDYLGFAVTDVAATETRALVAVKETALAGGIQTRIEHVEAFRPGRPVPTHRLTQG